MTAMRHGGWHTRPGVPKKQARAMISELTGVPAERLEHIYVVVTTTPPDGIQVPANMTAIATQVTICCQEGAALAPLVLGGVAGAARDAAPEDVQAVLDQVLGPLAGPQPAAARPGEGGYL